MSISETKKTGMMNKKIVKPMLEGKVYTPFIMSILFTPVSLFVGLYTYVLAIIDVEGLPHFIAIPLLGVVSVFVILKYREEWIAKQLENKDKKLDIAFKEKELEKEKLQVETMQKAAANLNQ